MDKITRIFPITLEERAVVAAHTIFENPNLAASWAAAYIHLHKTASKKLTPEQQKLYELCEGEKIRHQLNAQSKIYGADEKALEGRFNKWLIYKVLAFLARRIRPLTVITSPEKAYAVGQFYLAASALTSGAQDRLFKAFFSNPATGLDLRSTLQDCFRSYYDSSPQNLGRDGSTVQAVNPEYEKSLKNILFASGNADENDWNSIRNRGCRAALLLVEAASALTRRDLEGINAFSSKKKSNREKIKENARFYFTCALIPAPQF